MQIVGGWDRTDVAKAQLQRVMSELQNADHVAPFAEFVKAMKTTGIQVGRLLDVGCGVGHYGVLCERNFPFVKYHGTDASPAIIAEAQLLAPLGVFEVREFADNDFEWFDIVLASQVIEIAGNCWSNLRLLLSHAKQFVILNRIRLTKEPSHPIEETTYCGYSGREWLWNMAEIEHVKLLKQKSGLTRHEQVSRQQKAIFSYSINYISDNLSRKDALIIPSTSLALNGLSNKVILNPPSLVGITLTASLYNSQLSTRQ